MSVAAAQEHTGEPAYSAVLKDRLLQRMLPETFRPALHGVARVQR